MASAIPAPRRPAHRRPRRPRSRRRSRRGVRRSARRRQIADLRLRSRAVDRQSRGPSEHPRHGLDGEPVHPAHPGPQLRLPGREGHQHRDADRSRRRPPCGAEVLRRRLRQPRLRAREPDRLRDHQHQRRKAGDRRLRGDGRLQPGTASRRGGPAGLQHPAAQVPDLRLDQRADRGRLRARGDGEEHHPCAAARLRRNGPLGSSGIARKRRPPAAGRLGTVLRRDQSADALECAAAALPRQPHHLRQPGPQRHRSG